MQRRFLLVQLIFSVLILILFPIAVRAQSARCFAETGYCIEGVIRDYWEQNGGLAVFGYPTTSLQVETNNDGWTGPTQWFERDRLEDHGSEGVLAGRLGAGLLELQGRSWQTFPAATDVPSDCRYFAQTQHSMCEPFKRYWEQNGGLERFGYPITEPFYADLAGWSGTVQYFERRRMEHHTELAGTQYEVLLGLLGNEVRAISSDTPYPAPGQPSPTPTPSDSGDGRPRPGTCLTAQDQELVELVNIYRADNGLPPVPIAKSLTHVAQAHVLDLHDNEPDSGSDSRGMACNMHSWSDKGNWSPVCYTSDHAYASGMWDKPREITGNIYEGNGYEIAYGSSAQASPASALRSWQGSASHNAVIIERDGWGVWQAMGVAVYEHHAVVWFGTDVDPQGTLAACP